ncbi:response regulator [Vibrio sp. Of7-15]|uniref:response regulator n=1 Tax=Vibrio sp. Of7-15 TaxID=2724879 RepID=UPI001EF3C689|nr:response regulator [Vibrio sp. Of7-15]MCG7497229.1 response regulator [Vibrio sp. Of7-15]
MTSSQYNTVSILLVEDDDVDAMGIKRALNKLRVANPLHRACDGIEALSILREEKIQHPYLILLDLNMPRMSGLEMLEELRADPQLTDSIVFVLTTSKDDEDIMAAYKEHISGYIVKSQLNPDFTELFELLDHYWRLVEFPTRSQCN